MSHETIKKRPRLTFDVEEQLLKAVEEAAAQRHETIRELSVQAVQESLEPGLQFRTHRRRGTTPLDAFLHTAQEEIAIAGMTLGSLHDEAVIKVLRQKVAAGQVAMRFLMIDPDIDEQDPVYQILSKRYGNSCGGGGLRGELQKTCEILESLHREGLRVGCSVRVMGIKTLPMVGLTIVDPYSPQTKIRLALYLQVYPHESPPFFEVDTRSEAAREAGYVLLRHYDRLTDGARLIYGES